MKYEQNTNLQHYKQAMFDTFNGLNFHQAGTSQKYCPGEGRILYKQPLLRAVILLV